MSGWPVRVPGRRSWGILGRAVGEEPVIGPGHFDRRLTPRGDDDAGWREISLGRSDSAECGGEEVPFRRTSLIGDGKLMTRTDYGGYRAELKTGPAEHVAGQRHVHGRGGLSAATCGGQEGLVF